MRHDRAGARGERAGPPRQVAPVAEERRRGDAVGGDHVAPVGRHQVSSSRAISIRRDRKYANSRVKAIQLTKRASPMAGSSGAGSGPRRSEEHTSELQSHVNLVCRLLLEKKKKKKKRRDADK